MSSSSPFDASIPVLTEVIDTQALLHQEALPAAAAPSIADQAEQAGSAVVVDAFAHHAAGSATALEQAPAEWAPTDAAPTDWAALEQRLCERILQQLQGQVGFLIEQRIRESMADALQLALASMAGQLADGLGGALEQIVTRAVGEELLHLRQK